ncbi:MAG: hypothetical protein ACLQPH_21605 [Acidimicrobiales bacterium]
MTSLPTWFGPADRPLFGWLHLPGGEQARGGVVLCPPLGDEERRVYRTYRALAESLADRGLAVLRFCYDGTGDSAGTLDDPGRVAAWTASIADAVAEMRVTGVTRVAAVGMRVGATLLTHAVADIDEPLDAVVLWDPCATGREFVRYQQALMATLPGRPAGNLVGVDTPGYVFPVPVVEDLRSLEIRPVEAPGTEVLVLSRVDRPAPHRLERGLGERAVSRAVAVGQEELLDVPPLSAVVPRSALATICGWLDRRLDGDDVPLAVTARTEATVATDRQGRPVTERAVRLGPLGLFAVVTEPVAGGHGPWMMFFNVATEHHIGPGRQWVELARRWAGYGLRSVRFDLSGVGDSPVHPGQEENVTYAPEWLDDAPAIAAAVSPEDPSDTVWIGLCSGGYGALETGLALEARGAYVFNPALSSASMNKASAQADPRRRAFRPLPVPLVRLSVEHGRTASWIWRAYRQVVVGQAPMSVPAALVDAGIDVLMICGPDDTGPLREVRYWRWFGERRLRRTGRFELAVVPSMDHVLLFGEGRRTGVEVLTEHVLRRYGDPVGTTPPTPAAEEPAAGVTAAAGRNGSSAVKCARSGGDARRPDVRSAR